MNVTAPVLSYLQNPAKTLPMLLIEVPTTLGRTYQGYKRGGKPEARERICEETLGGVVWLFGIKTFNKIGDVIGKHVLGLKDLDIDVGKDALRNPFENVTDKRALTAAFKFSKIAGSVALGTLAMGVVVPKVKHAMTNALRMQQGLEPIPDRKSPDGKYHEGWADRVVSKFIKYDKASINKPENKPLRPDLKSNFAPSMNDFLSQAKQNSPSFKGGLVDGILYASHNLENNTAWRLLSTDAGTLTGRVTSSRNKKEGIEYFVRDSISSLFYIFAAPFASKLLRGATKTPDIDPKCALASCEHIQEVVRGYGGSVKTGLLTDLLMKDSRGKDLVKNLRFDENKVITLHDFHEQTMGLYVGKADLMSELQPKILRDGVKTSILSERQAMDIMSSSPTTDPKFLKKAISLATGGRSESERAYVSRKKLEQIRASIDDYVRALDDYAQLNQSAEIDEKLIRKFTNHLNRKNLLIHFGGLAFAVLGLAYLIPKFQYYISERLTGETTAPCELKSDNKQN